MSQRSPDRHDKGIAYRVQAISISTSSLEGNHRGTLPPWLKASYQTNHIIAEVKTGTCTASNTVRALATSSVCDAIQTISCDWSNALCHLRLWL
uniref:Uncharacterized protein n=1 Tax=Anguilla anguilla TaxID=7936 RepID=A0A0E9XEI3_ANGAN